MGKSWRAIATVVYSSTTGVNSWPSSNVSHSTLSLSSTHPSKMTSQWRHTQPTHSVRDDVVCHTHTHRHTHRQRERERSVFDGSRRKGVGFRNAKLTNSDPLIKHPQRTGYNADWQFTDRTAVGNIRLGLELHFRTLLYSSSNGWYLEVKKKLN